MPYATTEQLIIFVDSRIIGDLAGDQDKRLQPAEIMIDPNVAAALSAAAAKINSSVLVGQRYTVEQLLAMVGDDLVYLQMLNAWLAFGILCGRRGRDPSEQPEYIAATETIKHIENGAQLFNLSAGQGQSQLPQTNFLSSTQWNLLNSLRSSTRGLFPQRRCQRTLP